MTQQNKNTAPTLTEYNERKALRNKRLANIGLGVLGAVGVGALGMAVTHTEAAPGNPQEKSAIEALQNGQTEVKNETITLKPGVTVRKTPHGPTTDAAKTGSSDNEAFSVEKGKKLVVEGLVTKDGWMAVQMGDTETSDIATDDDIEKNTYWVNLSEIEQQTNKDGEPFVVREPSVKIEGGQASLHSDGLIYDQGGHRVAVGYMVEQQQIPDATVTQGNAGSATLER